MKDKTIVLADSSYTIRRIVELSFSEIEDVEIVSFENGMELKNRLLEIKPRVIIVDVKLPGVSGYEICQFINQSEELKQTRIFLMKGSFEPVNQEWIKNLKFEEIITKPFDSNLLVAAVMKIIDESEKAKAKPAGAPSMPASLPEDFASIDTGTAVEDELNFSDIRDEIMVPGAKPKKGGLDEDEIQPSEEITQAQVAKDDGLAPEAETDDSLANPFEGEGADGIGGAKAQRESVKPPPVEPKLTISHLEEEMSMPEAAVADEETSDVIRDIRLGKEPAEAPEEGHFPGDLLEPAALNIDLRSEGESGAREERKAAETTKSATREAEGISGLFGETRPFKEARPPDGEGRFFPELGGIELDERPAKAPHPRPPAAPPDLPVIDKKEMEARLREQLSVSVREVLWEIIPRLAEKIIREEIDKIKHEAAKPQP